MKMFTVWSLNSSRHFLNSLHLNDSRNDNRNYVFLVYGNYRMFVKIKHHMLNLVLNNYMFFFEVCAGIKKQIKIGAKFCCFFVETFIESDLEILQIHPIVRGKVWHIGEHG